jgi:AcrR family transcriptional regulator
MDKTVARDDVRNAVLDAFETLLARSGYRKMTIDDIARESGIAKGTIYIHFPSKEEITLSHVDRIVEHVLDEMQSILRSRNSFPDRFRKMMLARVMIRFDSVQHYSQSLSDLLGDLRMRLFARREQHFQKEAKLFARLLAEAAAAGIVKNVDPESAAERMLSATNSFLPYSLSPQELGMRRHMEETVNQVSDLFLNGLLKP